MKNPIRFQFLLVLGLWFCFIPFSIAAEEIVVPISSDNEMVVQRFAAKGQYLIVWLAPEYGFRNTHRSFARSLTGQGIEVWQGDPAEALFLPQDSVSIKQLDGQYVADVIEYAHKTTGKKILVSGDSYGSISALLGAHQWQQRDISEPYLVGAVLFTPYTFAYIPPLGVSAEFLPVISSTNIPIMIYQAQNSGIAGQFQPLLQTLWQNNESVYARFVPGIMSLFYQIPPTKAMVRNRDRLLPDIKRTILFLDKHPLPQKPIPLTNTKKTKSGIDIYFKEFKGNNRPISIELKDINGAVVTKNDFNGQVTVINFWATWCPPCIEEIPSLNRLKTKMTGSPFELISINYAEDTHTIKEFMQKVNIDFTVLLDEDGSFSRQWNIVSFPSTFVIDKSGKIVYGVNAAIEWDNPELVQKLKSM